MTARAQVEVTASSNRLTAGLALARSKINKWAGSVARGIKGVTGNSTVGNILGNVQSSATGFIVQQAKEVMALDKSLTRFQIAAGKTPEAMNAMRKSIQGISSETAIASADILAGAQTYVDLTGDVKGAEKAMTSFSRIAQASGSTVSDVATATASMQMSMGLSSGDIENAFSGLIAQGKMGAVSLKDMAGELSTLGPMMAKFQGGQGLDGIRSMGAAFQVVRQGAGSAAEANTQLSSVITGVIAHAKTFEKAGVKIYDKDPKTGVKTLRSFHSIVEGISKSKLMKDPTALGKAFGRTEALAAFQSLSKNLELYDDLLKSGQDTAAVQKDLATFMNSSAGKTETAFNNMKLTIAEAFTPERIQMFVGALMKVGEWLAKTVGYIEKTVKLVDEVREKVMGPSVEKRADKLAKRFESTDLAQEAKYGAFGGSSSEGRRAKAQNALRRAAELETKEGGYSEDDEVEIIALRRDAARLSALADEWGNVKDVGIDKAKFSQRYAMADAEKFEKYDVQNALGAAKPVAEATLGLMLSELKKLTAMGGQPINMTADGNAIAKTTDNASNIRTAP